MKKAEPFIDELIQQQALPPEYKDLVGDYLWPLVQDMAAMHTLRNKTQSTAQQQSPWLVGLQGTQGSGKSTVCLFIKVLLEKCFDLNVVVLSIDDFYKTRQQRITLSQSVHPLLITRGVPGTHDIDLALHTLDHLAALSVGKSCCVPSFNKLYDERTDESHWPVISNKVDIILFEGWCMGLPAQTQIALTNPINELEKKEDPEGVWRGFVNEKLISEYKTLFDKLDHLIVLQAPSFKCVYQWRLLQEKKLANRNIDPPSKEIKTHIQTPEQIERFIAHYERLTRHALNVLTENASWVITLNEQHNMISLFRNNNLVRLE